MKVRLSFKTPDVVHHALADLSEEDRSAAEEIIERFVKYGECAVLEVDTDAGTCVVLKA